MTFRSFFEKWEEVQQKFKQYFFEKPIEAKKRKYQRKNNRSMDEDEVQAFMFRLFLFYCFPLVMICVFIIMLVSS